MPGDWGPGLHTVYLQPPSRGGFSGPHSPTLWGSGSCLASPSLSPSRGLDINMAGGGGQGQAHTPHNVSMQSMAAIPPLGSLHHSMLRGRLSRSKHLSHLQSRLLACPVPAVSLVVARLLWVEAVGPWEGKMPDSTSLPLAKGQSCSW